MSPESVDPQKLDDPRLIRQDLEDLKRAQEVAAATQVGAQATQTATQAGQASTMAAAQAGLMSTVVAGAVSLIVGMFLGMAIRVQAR